MDQSETEGEMNFMDHASRKRNSFDNASIRRELDAARAEWEQTFAEKGGAGQAEEKLNRGFELLMKRIRDAGIQPVTTEMYEQQKARG